MGGEGDGWNGEPREIKARVGDGIRYVRLPEVMLSLLRPENSIIIHEILLGNLRHTFTKRYIFIVPDKRNILRLHIVGRWCRHWCVRHADFSFPFSRG